MISPPLPFFPLRFLIRIGILGSLYRSQCRSDHLLSSHWAFEDPQSDS